MPYARPTLPTLIQQVQSDVASRLYGTNPWLPYSDLQILSYVFAGLQYSQFGYLDWISKQAIPVTSTDEALNAWAALKGLSLIPAAPASGTATFSGTPGSLVSDGTICVRADGTLYEIPVGDGGTLADDGIFTTTLIAVTAGAASNMAQGDPPSFLNLQNPIAGVLSRVTLASDFVGGADTETQESLRARLIEKFSNPPQGGSLSDYITWALAFPGVTRAWSAGPAIMGAGSVTVYFMMDNTEAAFNGIPQGSNGVSQYENRGPYPLAHATGDQLLLADYLYPLRPATAIVWSMAPVAVPLNITLAEVPADQDLRGRITTALTDFCLRKASPGGVTLADLSPGGIVRVSQLEDAISAVTGLEFFELISPIVDVVVGTGRINVPGTITYT